MYIKCTSSAPTTSGVNRPNVSSPSLNFPKFEVEQSSKGRLFQSLGVVAARALSLSVGDVLLEVDNNFLSEYKLVRDLGLTVIKLAIYM